MDEENIGTITLPVHLKRMMEGLSLGRNEDPDESASMRRLSMQHQEEEEDALDVTRTPSMVPRRRKNPSNRTLVSQ